MGQEELSREELKRRLAAAESALRAIRGGQVDAILGENETLVVRSLLERTEAIARVGSWEWDIELDQVTWSGELFRIFGWDPQTSAPSFAEHEKLFAPGESDRLKKAVYACVTEGTPYEIELRAIRADGETRHCIASGRPQRDKKGRIYRLVGTFQDITDWRHQKERIALLGRMVDEAPVCITIHDTEGRFFYVNRGTCAIHGYEEHELMAVNLYDLQAPESKPLFEERLRKLAEEGEGAFEVSHCRKNGTSFPLQVVAKGIEWQGRRAILGIASDITELKRGEEERKQLQAQLTQAQKMESVGRLAGGLAHDINNKLSVIMGYSELAMNQISVDDQLYADLAEIVNAAKRSAEITRQLLAFARKQTITPEVLDLNETIDGMLKMLNRLIGEDIALSWLPGKCLWPVKVDLAQIDQILVNLCVNARDAISGLGMITIETENTVLDENYCKNRAGFMPGEFVMLAVSDNGCGMDGEVLKNIFEPFFTTKEIGKGTGLGLSTVHGIVNQNSGFINVYSEPDNGTTIKIYLPRHSGSGIAGEASITKEDRRDIPESCGEIVLVVEDEPSVLKFVATTLERLGYIVLTASSPLKAIEQARGYAGRVHLLITDVIMPEMHGRDLAGEVLALYPDMKVLFMSGYTASVIAHHGVLDKEVNFIAKPLSIDTLAVKVRQALEKNS